MDLEITSKFYNSKYIFSYLHILSCRIQKVFLSRNTFQLLQFEMFFFFKSGMFFFFLIYTI